MCGYEVFPGHTGSERHSWDYNPASPTLESMFSTTALLHHCATNFIFEERVEETVVGRPSFWISW